MIWLTWRQLRTPALAVAGLTLVGAVYLLLTGPGIAEDYRSSGVAHCVSTGGAPAGGDRTCGDLAQTLLGSHGLGRGIVALAVLGAPALAGLFLGAPLLAREYEAGTHRLAWTQSASRARWLTTKLGFVGGAVVAVTALVSTLFTWWSQPFDRIGSRVEPGTFAQRGILPVALAAFGFALGVAAGAVVRRALPAMVVTLLLFVGVRMYLQDWVRPRLSDPVELSYPTFSFYAADPPGFMVAEHGWTVGRPRTVDRSGEPVAEGYPVADTVVMALCDLDGPDPADPGERPVTPTKSELDACGRQLGLRDVKEVHTSGSFWPLQLAESAILLGHALALLGFTYWWVVRRSA